MHFAFNKVWNNGFLTSSRYCTGVTFIIIEIFYVCEKDHELYTQQVYKYRQNISNTNMHIYYVKLTGTYISTLLHSSVFITLNIPISLEYINFLLFNLSNRY